MSPPSPHPHPPYRLVPCQSFVSSMLIPHSPARNIKSSQQLLSPLQKKYNLMSSQMAVECCNVWKSQYIPCGPRSVCFTTSPPDGGNNRAVKKKKRRPDAYLLYREKGIFQVQLTRPHTLQRSKPNVALKTAIWPV